MTHFPRRRHGDKAGQTEGLPGGEEEKYNNN